MSRFAATYARHLQRLRVRPFLAREFAAQSYHHRDPSERMKLMNCVNSVNIGLDIDI
jgi:PIN domain nuclease of toxin-antitoxin system